MIRSQLTANECTPTLCEIGPQLSAIQPIQDRNLSSQFQARCCGSTTFLTCQTISWSNSNYLKSQDNLTRGVEICSWLGRVYQFVSHQNELVIRALKQLFCMLIRIINIVFKLNRIYAPAFVTSQFQRPRYAMSCFQLVICCSGYSCSCAFLFCISCQ